MTKKCYTVFRVHSNESVWKCLEQKFEISIYEMSKRSIEGMKKTGGNSITGAYSANPKYTVISAIISTIGTMNLY